MRIENIVIVPDHCIREKAHVQRQLERTYLMLFRTLFYLFPRIVIRCSQQIKHSFIHAVKMPLCPRAGIRIAVRLVQYADFVFRGQNNALEEQPLRPQKLDSAGSSRSRDCFGGQIENLLRLPLSHGFDGRKKGCDCFAGAGRRFKKELASMHNRAVDVSRQLLLSFSVRERKCQIPDRLRPAQLPHEHVFCPFAVFFHQG